MIDNTYKTKDVQAEIRRTLQIFKPETSLVEIRSPKGYGGCKSGYFTNHTTLIESARNFQNFNNFTWYFVMNQINSDCYNLEQRDDIKTFMKNTTTDTDIIHRNWLLIDCDPIRKTDTSASDEEKAHAWNTLNTVYDYLQSRGFYEPLVCDSGNGYHLLYRIDTPNTKETTTIIANFLKVLDMQFTDEYVQIDTVVYNPARITKLYGTYAKKGADTPDRPHRQSYIIQAPEQLEITDITLIQSIADMLPKPEKPSYRGQPTTFDVRDFIAKHGIGVHKEMSNGTYTKFVLETCPFNPDHKAPDSAMFLYTDGALGFRCLHNSCVNNHWKEFRKLYEPDAYEKKPYTKITAREAFSDIAIEDNTADSIDLSPTPPVVAVSTWEDIIDENLLMSIFTDNNYVESLKQISVLNDIAKKLSKFREFKKIADFYRRKSTSLKADQYRAEHPDGIQLSDISSELKVSAYRVCDDGVFLVESPTYPIIPQPLIITKQFEDIESGIVKVKIAFKNKGVWKHHVVERETIANKNKIITLANVGLAVTSDNSNDIVRYLQALQSENPIPTQKSVSHLGYIGNNGGVGKRFVPYDDEITYSAQDNFSDIYKSIHTEGSHAEWVQMYHSVRDDNVAVRSAVATSFASVLLQPLGKPPFFTHPWGASDTGKTVLSRLVSSVWGYHDKYMLNMNGTSVGFEYHAAFFHNLPFVIDELMTVRNDKIDDLIYRLSEGQGRLRGRPNGIAQTMKWHCAFVTNGEQPLTRENSPTGSLNRVIDIPISGQIFKNPSYVYAVIDKNYGHAGRYFVEHLNEYKPREVLAKWETVLNHHNTTISGKHRMSLSVILTADELVNRMLFRMDESTAEADTLMFYTELSKLIITTAESDLTTRAYNFICNWVVVNDNKFKYAASSDTFHERWGQYSAGGTTVVIIGNPLRESLEKANFNYGAVLKGLRERNLLIAAGAKNIKQFRLKDGSKPSGIELVLPSNT